MSDGQFAVPAPGKPLPGRRSSSRAIKRKKFDDDWVESPVTPAKTVASKGMDGVNVGASTSTGIVSSPGIPSPVTPTPGPSSSAGPSFLELGVAAMSYSAPPAAAATRRHKELAAAAAAAAGTSAASPMGGAGAGPSTSGLCSVAGVSGASSVAAASASGGVGVGSRSRKKKGVKGRKKLTNVVELGRFKATDDLALINGVLQTNDLEAVHRAVKFSCIFTLQELTERWYALLYDSTLSCMAVQSIRNLHPETVAAVNSRALFSRAEENILASVGFSDEKMPTMDDFQDLLRKHPDVFHRGRTAKSVMHHWTLMKSYDLLHCQDGLKDQTPRSFYDVLGSLNDAELFEPTDDAAMQELQIQTRCMRKEIKELEEQVQHWNELARTVIGESPLPSFDEHTVAMLLGRVVCYKMNNTEASFGRAVKRDSVDMDLSLEGPSTKISRRQGTIKLRANGDFYVHNEGRRAFFVDGKAVLPNHKFKLHDNAVLEICRTVRLVFRVNEPLVAAHKNRAREAKDAKDLHKKLQQQHDQEQEQEQEQVPREEEGVGEDVKREQRTEGDDPTGVSSPVEPEFVQPLPPPPCSPPSRAKTEPDDPGPSEARKEEENSPTAPVVPESACRAPPVEAMDVVPPVDEGCENVEKVDVAADEPLGEKSDGAADPETSPGSELSQVPPESSGLPERASGSAEGSSGTTET